MTAKIIKKMEWAKIISGAKRKMIIRNYPRELNRVSSRRTYGFVSKPHTAKIRDFLVWSY